MLIKLALRNVKKNIKDYLIYILTVTLSVSLFYGFLAITSQKFVKQLPIQMNFGYFSKKMRLMFPLIGIVTIFLICYINSYILRRKQREFALEMLIGVPNYQIALTLFMETFLLGLFSIVTGILGGTVIAKIIAQISVAAFEVDYESAIFIYGDVCLYTLCYFCVLFIIVGFYNGYKISKTTIAKLLLAAHKYEEFKLGTYLSKWIKALLIMSFMIFLIFSTAYYKIQQVLLDGAKVLLLITIIISMINVIMNMCLVYMIRKRRKIKVRWAISIAFMSVVLAILLLANESMLEYAVGLGLLGMFYYTMPPLMAALVGVCSIIIFWGGIGEFVLVLGDRHQKFKMDNLFVYGQIKDKLQINCKTMSILTIVLSLIFVVVGWIPVNVARMNGYLEERSIYDVQIFSRYNVVDKIEDLNNIELNTEEIRKYLTMKGCEITGEAKVSCYYPQIEDFYKNANKDKPNLIIPVSEYNQLLRMNKTEEINLQDNEYAIAWAPSVLEEEIRESSKSDSTLTVGEEELYKKSDYQYNVGMGIFTSGLEASYIVPDHICNKLTRATVYYAANTKEKIPVNLAKEIEKEVTQTLNVKNSYNVDLYYVRLQALQINEGISNSLMLRLGATYIGLLLLLLSLAILSLQQLTDSLEHSWRFIVISKIGVSVEKIVHYIRQQMYVWFGVPFVIACFVGNMINIYMVWSDYEEYFPYISIGESIVTGLLGNVVVAIFFLLYLLMTYYIFQHNLKQAINKGANYTQKSAFYAKNIKKS